MLELPKAHSVGIGPIGKIRSPDNIVVIGLFWWYGVLEAARAGMKVQGVVSFHGGLRQRVNNVIKRVLVLHGADDLYVPAAEVTAFQQEMRYESRLGNDLLR
jgi:hypothetical protein